MGRPLRMDPPGRHHHVWGRGARRQDIFLDDGDRLDFIWQLVDSTARAGVEITAYALMGNHYHLVLYCPDGHLSEAMHHLLSLYVRGFNQEHGFDGPLCKSRFDSRPIESLSDLVTATRYVHRNPLDIGRDVARYPWSSYGSYIDLRPRPTWLRPELPLRLIGGAERYRRFVEGHLSPGVPWSNGPPALPPATPDGRSVTLGEVENAVSVTCGVPVARLHSSERGQKNLPRTIAVLLAVEEAGYSHEEVANHYALDPGSGFRTLLYRARRARSNNTAIAHAYDRAAEALRSPPRALAS